MKNELLTTESFNSNLRVSVIIPAYNAEHTIKDALASIEKQTYQPYEIIIVDDGSDQPLSDFLDSVRANVCILRKVQGGASSARNFGIAKAKGDLIAFLDADDVWEPKRLYESVKVFEIYPEVDLTASRYKVQEAEESSVFISGPLTSMTNQVLSFKGYDIFRAAKKISTPTVTIRKSALLDLPFDTNLTTAEDRDLWIRILSKSKCYLISLPLVTILMRAGSLSHSSINTDCQCMKQVIHRYSDTIGFLGRMKENSIVHFKWATGIGGGPQSWMHLLKSLLYWPFPLDQINKQRRFFIRLRFFASLAIRTLFGISFAK